MKDELRNLISGKGKVRNAALIKTTARYLAGSQRASPMVKKEKRFKEEETTRLKEYIAKRSLWVSDIDFSLYVSEGAEQKVYLHDSKHVYKLNDTIYYTSWLDYFHNLLLHNFFFPDTAYKLKGFTEDNNVLYAVVEQPFVRATSQTDLQAVKTFLTKNGFLNTKNYDYYNPDLGIILEDLHDENVLTEHNTLRFIDTVFYIKEDVFYVD